MGAILTPLEENPGLLVEEIGTVRTTTVTWSIAYNVGLRGHIKRADELANQIEKFRVNAGTSNFQEEPRKLQARLQESVSDLNKMVGPLKPRSKRSSPLGFVGEIQRVLFGTLTEKDGRIIEEMIELSANDTRKVAKLLANQTEIIQTEFLGVNKRVTAVENRLTELIKESDKVKWNWRLAVAHEALVEEVTQYEIDNELLVEAIMLASTGAIHPRIFPDEQVGKSAEIIQDANVEAEFPLSSSETTVTKVTEISEVKILLTNESMTYILEIPLLDFGGYNLYRIHPFPVKQRNQTVENLMAYIWPDNAHVAVAFEREAWFPIDGETLQNCKRNGNVHICGNKEAIREVDDSASCEIKIIMKEVPDLMKCDIKIKTVEETQWLKLRRDNAWAFSAGTEDQIFETCKKKAARSYKILGNGILELDPGCSVRTKKARLTATQRITTGGKTEIMGNLTLNIEGVLNQIESKLAVPVGAVLRENEQSGALSSRSDQGQSLATGARLQDIITQAKAMGKYNKIKKVFDEQGNNLWLYITIIILSLLIVIIMLGLGLAFCPRGGPRKLITDRLFQTGKRKRENQETPPGRETGVHNRAINESMMSVDSSDNWATRSEVSVRIDDPRAARVYYKPSHRRPPASMPDLHRHSNAEFEDWHSAI